MVIGAEAMVVVMPPTSSASEIPATREPFASAGTCTVTVFEAGAAVGADVAAGERGSEGALPPPPPPHAERNRKDAAIKSSRRTLFH